GGYSQGPATVRIARPCRSRLRCLLCARRRGRQQQVARALGGGHDCARRRVQAQRGHSGGGGPHVVRQAEPSGRDGEAARGVPSLLSADAGREAGAARVMRLGFLDLIRRSQEKNDGYSRALQAARVRAAYQRSYFAPALFNLVPVETDLIGSMAVDAHWRL